MLPGPTPWYIDSMENTYFRKGFGLKSEIAGRLTADYHSAVVEALRHRDYRLEVGRLTFRLAREFGFCYGVDRAVEYAYETRTKFPERRIFLVGEIIHNPHVNEKLRRMGITILSHGSQGDFDFYGVTPDDVVIMPAFGVTIRDFQLNEEWLCDARKLWIGQALEELEELLATAGIPVEIQKQLASRHLVRLQRPKTQYSVALIQCFERAWRARFSGQDL